MIFVKSGDVPIVDDIITCPLQAGTRLSRVPVNQFKQNDMIDIRRFHQDIVNDNDDHGHQSHN